MNNKTLGIAFAALLLIYLGIKFLGGNKERSFDSEIFTVDTSAVNRIEIDPANESPFVLDRSSGKWTILRDGREYEATTTAVSGLLGNVQKIEVDRIVSKDPAHFADYSVNDSLGTMIKLYNGNSLLGDLTVGRFSFNQATRSGISYLRLTDEDEVYSSEGFLSMSLAQGLDGYRNKSILTLNGGDITRISQQATDMTTLQKMGTAWQNDEGVTIDSTSMASYLSTLGSVMGSDFADEMAGQLGTPVNSLQFEGNNMTQPATVNVYMSPDTSRHFVIHSTMNPEAYFLSDSVGVYSRIFGKFHELTTTGE